MSDPKTPSESGFEVVEKVDVLDRPSPYEHGGGMNDQAAPYELDDE